MGAQWADICPVISDRKITCEVANALLLNDSLPALIAFLLQSTYTTSNMLSERTGITSLLSYQ